MRTEHLAEFIKVAECGSINAAAKELFLTRSVLSTHMTALEQELQFVLFDRDGAAKLTPAGSMFLVNAKSVINSLNKSIASCRAFVASTPNERATRIAFPALPAKDMPRLSSKIGMPLELVHFDMFQTFFFPLEHGIADVQLGFDWAFSSELYAEATRLGLESSPMRFYPCKIFVGAKHPLAKLPHDLNRRDLQTINPLEITVSPSGDFEHKWHVIATMLGIQNFSLLPLAFTSDYGACDLSQALFLCFSDIESEALTARDDMRAFDTLDGNSFGYELVATYHKNPSRRTEMFLQRLGSLYADAT